MVHCIIKVCVSLIIFCLVDLSIGVCGVLKYPTFIVLMLISPFILISICLTYCSAPRLGAYIYIYIYNCCIFLDWSFDHLVVFFFVSFHSFISKCILSDMSIATLSFFWSPFAWNIFFQPFTFCLYVSLVLRWVSCRQLI